MLGDATIDLYLGLSQESVSACSITISDAGNCCKGKFTSIAIDVDTSQ